MESQTANSSHSVRYQPDERPPRALAIGLGLQAAILTFTPVIIVPLVVLQAADQSGAYMSWAIFMAVLISGITTLVQVVRVGRFGAGHVLIMGTSGSFIAVSISALTEGGPALLATLIMISSAIQFVLAARLSLLRRIVTPVVSGTVLALIAISIAPIIFDMLTDVPEGTPASAAPMCAVITLGLITALTLRAPDAWRLWAPIIGMGGGCIVAAFFGLYDMQRVADAAWIGLPNIAWPGLDLTFDGRFWLLLPSFVFVTLIGAVDTIADATAIQRISWRDRRAVDLRVVQGAVNADGLGNLLSGLAGTIPNATYSNSLSLAEMTGVGARSVGVYIGLIFLGLAFLPKVTALLIAIPAPVVGAYVFVLLALIFVQALKLMVQDGIDTRMSLIVGLGFWVGVGFQNQAIFTDYLGGTLGKVLENGMTAGGLTLLVLLLFMELTAPRRSRLAMELDIAGLPQLDAFLRALAARMRWNAGSTERLCSAGEEALLSLVHQEEDETEREGRHLLVVARNDHGTAELDFIAALGEDNLEDRMLILREQVDRPNERELSLRLLRHFASSVRHQQYHDIDIVTVRVDGSG